MTLRRRTITVTTAVVTSALLPLVAASLATAQPTEPTPLGPAGAALVTARVLAPSALVAPEPTAEPLAPLAEPAPAPEPVPQEEPVPTDPVEPPADPAEPPRLPPNNWDDAADEASRTPVQPTPPTGDDADGPIVVDPADEVPPPA